MPCFFFLSARKRGLFFEEYGTYHKNAKTPDSEVPTLIL